MHADSQTNKQTCSLQYSTPLMGPSYLAVSLSSHVICWQGEAVQLLVDGKAPAIQQPAEGATYEPIMKKELAQVA